MSIRKFNKDDAVRVISGRYKGCTGTVIDPSARMGDDDIIVYFSIQSGSYKTERAVGVYQHRLVLMKDDPNSAFKRQKMFSHRR